MTRNRIVRIMNPINWIGLRPHVSMKRKDTQYPGMRPATERTRFPIPLFRRPSKTERDVLVGSYGLKCMADKIIELFRPRP